MATARAQNGVDINSRSESIVEEIVLSEWIFGRLGSSGALWVARAF